MDVKGKIWVFVKEVGKDDKKSKIFETSISRKDGEKFVDSLSLQLDFSKSLLDDKKKAKFDTEKAYQMNIEGFLSTRSYTDKNGNRRIEPVIKVLNAGYVLDENKKPVIKDVKRKAKEEQASDLETIPL